ncbi:MAG: F0F1 ATP synthase subunit gamma [Planctomycetota bacterium]
MNTMEELRRKIGSVEDMQSVVTTMKTLAAARIRQFESAARATQTYSQSIRWALQILMHQRRRQDGRQWITNHRPSGQTALVLLGSDQGFCGRFNESVATAAISHSSERDNPTKEARPLVLAIGIRLSQRLLANGAKIDKTLQLPNSPAGITKAVQQMLVQLEHWQTHHDVDRIELVFNHRQSASQYTLRQVQLLPISADYLNQLSNEPWESRSLPHCSLPWESAFASVLRQHIFLELFLALTESLASENASRIAAMQRAETNISEKLHLLQADYHSARQRAITEEIFDIISGVEASS